MLTLAQFAFADYSRSAATSVTCHSCSGTGFISGNEDVVKHHGISTMTVPKWWPRRLK